MSTPALATTSVSPAQRTVTLSGTTILAVTNAVVTSLATQTTPDVLAGVGLTGAKAGGPYVGTGTSVAPRAITVTTSASAGAYLIGTPITVKGTDRAGNTIQDTLTLTQTGGGETISSAKGFATVTEIDIPAMANTAGAFTFGIGDVVMGFRYIRVGTAGNVTYRCAQDGSTDTIDSVTAGEWMPVAGSALSSAASTTAQNITLGE
jgi:hypothetical protein